MSRFNIQSNRGRKKQSLEMSAHQLCCADVVWVSARGINALCSHCHRMLTILLMLPPPFSFTCGPEDKIQLWCTVPSSFSLDFSMSLTGSAALSLFSTSKETRKKKKKREAKGGERQKGSEREREREELTNAVWESVKKKGGAEGYRVESGCKKYVINMNLADTWGNIPWVQLKKKDTVLWPNSSDS